MCLRQASLAAVSGILTALDDDEAAILVAHVGKDRSGFRAALLNLFPAVSVPAHQAQIATFGLIPSTGAQYASGCVSPHASRALACPLAPSWDCDVVVMPCGTPMIEPQNQQGSELEAEPNSADMFSHRFTPPLCQRLHRSACDASAQLHSVMDAAGVGLDGNAALGEALRLLGEIQDSPQDVSDSVAANAFDLVSEAATTHSRMANKHLVRKMQDVLVLSCCRHVDAANKKMLRRSLTNAFGRDIGGDLESKLLNARFQLFDRAINTVSLNNDRRVRQRLGDSTGADDALRTRVSSSECEQCVSRAPTPDFGKGCGTTPPASAAQGSETYQVNIDPTGREQCQDMLPTVPFSDLPLKVQNTFLETDNVSESSRALSCAATSCHRKWPRAARHHTHIDSVAKLAPRQDEVEAILHEIADAHEKVRSNPQVVGEFLSHVLDQIQGPVSSTFAEDDTTASGGDAAAKSRDRALLLDVARQSQDAWGSLEYAAFDCENVLQGAELWVQKSLAENLQGMEKRRQMIHRFKLVGLVFGALDTVAKMLFKALDIGYRTSEFDEDLITSAFRALVELDALGLLEPHASQCIIQHITDARFRPKQQFCHSAYVGILGTLCNTSTRMELWGKVVSDIVDTCNYWLPLYNTDGIVFESVWALNQLFAVAGSRFLKRWADKCWALATRVKTDPYLVSCCDGWEEGYPDAVAAVRQAGKLELLLRPMCRHLPKS